jgi:hypothetical protein
LDYFGGAQVSYIIRVGRKRGEGDYWTQPDPDERRCEFSSDRTHAVRYDSYQKACEVAGNLSDRFEVRIVKLKAAPRPRASYLPDGPFAPGDLVCIGRDPEVDADFYGGLGRIVERAPGRHGGIYWSTDMLEPYRNGRYEFRSKYLLRVAPPLPHRAVPRQGEGQEG